MENPIIQLSERAIRNLRSMNINPNDKSLVLNENVRNYLETGECRYLHFGTPEDLYDDFLYESYDCEGQYELCSDLDNNVDIHKYMEDELSIDARIDKLSEGGLEGAELLSAYMIGMQDRTTHKINSMISEAMDSVMEELKEYGYELEE